MIGSTARWMTALATAALLALPCTSRAQAPPPSSPLQSSQPPSASAAGPDAQSPPAQDDSRQTQETARRHLTDARDALSQLTQLPAAAQLAGDARTQVSQLITNFNELITTQSNWRAAYAKVDANLNALLGPASSSAENPPAAPVSSGGAAPPAGVAGTSGTVPLDPTIRAKLAEVRTHLNAFTEAAGAPAPSAPSAAPSAPSSPMTPPPSAAPAGSPPAAAPDKPASAPPAAAPDKPASEAAAAAAPPAAPPDAPPTAASDAMRHIEAIEAILGGNAVSAANPNTPSTGRATLTAAQIEQIRKHLAELQKAIAK